MNSIKKILVTVFIVFAACSSVFAADDIVFEGIDHAMYSNALSAPYTKTSARIMAMGGAGLAVFNNQDSLYINPASLGARGLVFNMPNVAVTLYNVKGIYDTGIVTSAIEDPSIFTDPEKLSSTLLGSDGKPGILSALSGYGRNKLATVDAGVGFKLGRFALAVDTQVNLNTYTDTGNSIADIQIIPQVDAALTAGIGLRFFRDSAINFDIGVSAALQIRAFMESISAQDALDMIPAEGSESDPMAILNAKPVAIGWAVPLTVGANVNFPFGFTLAAVASNIQLVNGGYNYMITNIEGLTGDPMSIVSDVFESDAFTAKSDMNLSLGFGWSPDLGGWEWLADPTVAFDVVDVIGLFDDISLDSFLTRVKVGAELQLFKFLELRGGLNSGYASVGLGINLFNLIHLEASYYWNEFGENLGDRDVDALTIRLNILWER